MHARTNSCLVCVWHKQFNAHVDISRGAEKVGAQLVKGMHEVECLLISKNRRASHSRTGPMEAMARTQRGGDLNQLNLRANSLCLPRRAILWHL